MLIKGIPVTLYVKTAAGKDGFGKQLYTEAATVVNNVLVAPAEPVEVLSDNSPNGKKYVYTLGIPKGDTHDWSDAKVSFLGHTYRTFGGVTEGIEDLVPGDWHKKVKAARCE